MRIHAAILCGTLLISGGVGTALADLTKARAQPNLDRRARLALDNAALQLRAASEDEKAGDWGKAKEALAEITRRSPSRMMRGVRIVAMTRWSRLPSAWGIPGFGPVLLVSLALSRITFLYYLYLVDYSIHVA